MTPGYPGALAGVAFGAALLLLAWWTADRRSLSTWHRIAPYVGLPGRAPVKRHDRNLGISALLAMVGMDRSSAAADAGLEARLHRAGRPGAPRYRMERVVWSAVGAGAGLGVVVAASPRASLPTAAVLAVSGAVAGWLACDTLLRRQGRRRQEVIEEQLPLLADLVALGVSAGAPPLDAVERAAGTLGGPLGHEVAVMIASIHGGTGLDVGLRGMAGRVGSASLERFADGLIVAVERGTPLADVARAQAADIRTEERRRLMESAGRRDVSMLLPIVFLVLPTVVLIALFPGWQSFRLVVP